MTKSILISASMLGCALIATGAEAKKQKQPNVILVMVDDMGYGDFGCYGNTYHKTPNIDYLCENGAKFTDFHSNGAVSSPTRAALITGRYQQFSGISGVVSAASHRHVGLPLESNSLARILKGNGYSTAIYGKWHLGYETKYNPINFGFDEFVGYVSGNVDYFSHIDQAKHEDWWHQDKLTPEEGYTTELIGKYAVDYLKRDHKKPFFLYLPFEACHSPFQSPKGGPIRGRKPNDKPNLKQDIKITYKEMVESLDLAMGQIIATIKEQGLEENTLVLFFSDNGGAPHSCNYPLSGHKSSVLEGGHRVSSIAYQPGTIKKGLVIDETVLTMDIMPMLCQISNTSMKGVTTDGISYWDVMTKGAKMPERTLFWRTYTDIAVRKGDWKLTYNYRNKKTNELFDLSTVIKKLVNLKTDLAEKVDVASEHPEIVKELSAEAQKWESSFAHISQESEVPTNIIQAAKKAAAK